MSNSLLQERFTFDHEKIGRCSAHDIIKGRARAKNGDKERRCAFCKHYTLSLKANTCLDCLATEDLDNFKFDEVYLLMREKYMGTKEHAQEEKK